MVISVTINKYSYITARELPPFFGYRHRIRYFQYEEAQELDEINHPSVRETTKFLDFPGCLDISHNSDLPSRSGLGSSSTFTVGMVHSLRALMGQMASKRELAVDAIHIEQNVIGESVGSQDQVAAAFGGLNKISFDKTGDFEVEPIPMSATRLGDFHSHLLLCFTGFARTASEIAELQLARMGSNQVSLDTISRISEEALKILSNSSSPLPSLGTLLSEQWEAKRSLSDAVSTEAIDEIYDRGIAAGATGGKLLGAGGGGFMLFFADPDRHAAIISTLGEKMFVPFRFEHAGSSIIHYSHS